MSTTSHRRVITLHRWLGLLISLQLIGSALGGLYWATRDHKEAKGLTRRKPYVAAPIAMDGVIPLATLVGTSGATAARVFTRGDRVLWEVERGGRTERFDAKSGEPAGAVSESEAIAIAMREYAGPGTSATAALIEKDPPIDWMQRPLPVWRVAIDDEYGTRAYVDPQTGAIGNNWFTDEEGLWAQLFVLHVMDYDGGPLEKNRILALFALGVIATAVSGLTLWAFRIVAHRRSRKQAAA